MPRPTIVKNSSKYTRFGGSVPSKTSPFDSVGANSIVSDQLSTMKSSPSADASRSEKLGSARSTGSSTHRDGFNLDLSSPHIFKRGQRRKSGGNLGCWQGDQVGSLDNVSFLTAAWNNAVCSSEFGWDLRASFYS